MTQTEDPWAIYNSSSVGFSESVVGGASLLLDLLVRLWYLYVDYLWHYEEHPWIVRSAATFQLLAIVMISPFAFLSMLDVGAYVIARTLGVVETTRASTSDSDSKSTDSDVYGSEPEANGDVDNSTSVDLPMVHIDVTSEDPKLESNTDNDEVGCSSSSGLMPSTATRHQKSATKSKSRFDTNLVIPTARYPSGNGLRVDGPEADACFFSPTDERTALELSGALLSSPASSRQASPEPDKLRHRRTLRTNRPRDQESDSANGDANSSAESESFTVLESADLSRDEKLEHDSGLSPGVRLRRRQPGSLASNQAS